jgi:RNA polymerase sigma-70 factor (ECF subfamily)
MKFRDWLDRDMFLEGTDDDALVASVLAGDTDALGTLLKKWQRPLLKYVSHRVRNSHDAEEITQLIMLNIIKAMKDNPPKNFQSWSYTVAQNTIASYFRKEKPTTLEEPEEARISSSGKKMGRVGLPLPVVTDEGDPIQKAIDKEEKAIILQTLKDMESGDEYEKKKAKILRMRFYQHMKLSEIAAELDVPLGTVKRIIHFGVKDLKKDLRKKGIEE